MKTTRKDRRAIELLCTLATRVPCPDCGGWKDGYGVRFFVDKLRQRYVVVIEDDNVEEAGSDEYNRSVELSSLFPDAISADLQPRTIHIDSKLSLLVDFEDEMTGTIFSVVTPLLLSAEEFIMTILPEFFPTPPIELWDDRDRDDYTATGAVTRAAIAFRRSCTGEPTSKPANSLGFNPVAEVRHMFQKYSLDIHDLNSPIILPVVLAAVGYKLNTCIDKDKLGVKDRNRILSWAIKQSGQLKCQLRVKRPPKVYRDLLIPM